MFATSRVALDPIGSACDNVARGPRSIARQHRSHKGSLERTLVLAESSGVEVPDELIAEVARGPAGQLHLRDLGGWPLVPAQSGHPTLGAFSDGTGNARDTGTLQLGMGTAAARSLVIKQERDLVLLGDPSSCRGKVREALRS